MAGNPRMTVFFSLGKAEWTETHWLPQSNTLQDAVPLALTFAKQRSKLLGTNTKMSKIRLSFDGIFRDSLLVGQDNIPSNPQGLAVVAAGGAQVQKAEDLVSDIPNVCVIVRAEAGELRRKTIYLGGNPDALAGGNWPDTDINPGLAWWGKAFSEFSKSVINLGCGYIGRKVQPKITQVIKFQGDATPPLMYGALVGNGSLGGAPTVGTYMQLRGFSVKAGAQKINGRYQLAEVSVVGNDQLFMLRNSLNIDPSAVVKWGTIEIVESEFLAYSALLPQYIHTRKRGGRTGLPLGRRKIKK